MKNRLFTIIMTIALTLSMAIPVLADDVQDPTDPQETCTHEWSDWYVEVEPDCGNPGLEHRECSLCESYEERQIPATGNHWWSEWETTVKPTIKKAGKKERYCEECSAVQKKSIAKLKPFVKFKKKTFKVKKGKSLKLKTSYAKGDKIKKWKSSKKSVATVNKKGKIVGKKTGKARITVIMSSGKKATCTVKVVKAKTSAKTGGGKVYWTPGGSVYHLSRNCRTLKRSRVIKSGTIRQSGKKRACKVCG